MGQLITLIEQQSPFVQGFIASATFALATWLFRTIKRRLQKAGVAVLRGYEYQEVAKHWLHRHYVRSNNAILANHGISFVALQAFRYCLIGSLLFIFLLGVEFAVSGRWLLVIGSWFAFNSFLEAFTWIRDSSDPKRIEKIDEEIKMAFYSSLPENAPGSLRKTGTSTEPANNQVQPTANATTDS